MRVVGMHKDSAISLRNLYQRSMCVEKSENSFSDIQISTCGWLLKVKRRWTYDNSIQENKTKKPLAQGYKPSMSTPSRDSKDFPYSIIQSTLDVCLHWKHDDTHDGSDIDEMLNGGYSVQIWNHGTGVGALCLFRKYSVYAQEYPPLTWHTPENPIWPPDSCFVLFFVPCVQ